tara:strand:+ start:80 stop:298 length:219 start_codon:yes stop_codon:yes gene_type:complete
MKTCIRMIFVVAAALLLSACAAPEPQARASGFLLADGYMQAVERNARNKGIDVVWINAPARSLARKDDADGD